MIDKQAVQTRLIQLGGLEESELEQIDCLIDGAIAELQPRLRSAEAASDSRVVTLAAAMALHGASLCGGDSQILSFTAGDVKIQPKDRESQAARFLRSALYAARHLIRDDAFCFAVV
ncbi:MAG: hypothetical protein LIO46_05395 [Clostridiales bacterium]|nr:hypothetical protein [Clostridiales bacterium]